MFDAATISDRATFEKPMEPSVGVRYLVVGGTVVVDVGRIVPDVFPGRAISGREKLGPTKGARDGPGVNWSGLRAGGETAVDNPRIASAEEGEGCYVEDAAQEKRWKWINRQHPASAPTQDEERC